MSLCSFSSAPLITSYGYVDVDISGVSEEELEQEKGLQNDARGAVVVPW